jgi:hypothetical protein
VGTNELGGEVEIRVGWGLGVSYFVEVDFGEVGPDEAGEDEGIKDFAVENKVWINLTQSRNVERKTIMPDSNISIAESR